MPTSSNARGGNGSFCARGLVASSVTFAARSRATQRSKTALARCSISRCGFDIKSPASGSSWESLARGGADDTIRQGQRGPKVYSLHAPEVECIGRGKARASYEFGCKVSIATPVTAPKGGQFVLHAKALHGNPYDGHTLGPVIADLEKLTGVTVRRIHGDKGYRGHNYPNRFKVWIMSSGCSSYRGGPKRSQSLLDALEGSIRIFEKHRIFLLSCSGSSSAPPPGDAATGGSLSRRNGSGASRQRQILAKKRALPLKLQ